MSSYWIFDENEINGDRVKITKKRINSVLKFPSLNFTLGMNIAQTQIHS
ncbi:MAG: hypothetical protein CM15mP41_0020 [Flammeovirgaceae bacterium]|nr:MAG: hypothetical protein CM15mP41_0020 [Flammeovirgaceae bacterium]